MNASSQDKSDPHASRGAVQDNSPARILVLALGNGFAYTSLMYFVYSMMKLKYRKESERYSELTHDEPVFVQANNLNGFLSATANRPQGEELNFEISRTSLEKTRNREDARVRLCKGDIARLCSTDEDVTVMSDPPCQVSSDALYDVMYYDGTHGKENIWNLRVPSRDPYVVGHFNPAVTYAATLLGEIHPNLGLMYVCAQIFGGIAGAAFVRGLFGASSLEQRGGLSLPASEVTSSQALLSETVLCAILVTVQLTIWVAPTSGRWRKTFAHPFRREVAPLIVGLVTACLTIVGSTTSRAPMNISRTLGVAIVTDSWTSQWIYPLAGWLGAILGTFMWLQTTESVIFWSYGYEMISYSVYKLLSLVTFGTIDTLFRNNTKSQSPIRSHKIVEGVEKESKDTADDDDGNTSSKTQQVDENIVVDTAVL